MSHRMEFKTGSPHRTTQSEYSRYQTKLTGSSITSQQNSRSFEMAAASLNRGNAVQKGEFVSVLRASKSLDLAEPKMDEKELLHGLNDRFAGFIEKVHHLEHQNQLLEREIEDIKQKAQSPSSLVQQYEPELRDLRKLVNDIMLQKHQIEIEHQDLEEAGLTLREKYDQEARNRSDAESNIIMLKKDINDTYLTKLQLDKKAESMVDEIYFLKKNHEVKVSEMLAQMQETQVKVETHDFGITTALLEIRVQLEHHTVSDIQQAEEGFRVQFAKLTEAAETHREALKATKQEIQEYRRHLQGKNIELDCAKGMREALAKQLNELEDRHNAEMVHYQDTMRQLENELVNAKFDMSGHLREHQDLLNVKMALDVEILSYRQLLEGEESRLSTISDTHISMPYTYCQSPVYTLPCLDRQGGPTRRAEPQNKFVEEVITETIREVEMSKFEDTRSEEAVEGEGDYQRKGEDHAKAERGSSEEKEEKEDKAALCEETPEKEDEQVSEDQQVENMEATKHGNGVSPAEAEEGDAGKVETGEEPDTVEKMEDTVKPIQTEVKSVETTSDDEKDTLDTAEDIYVDLKDDMTDPKDLEDSDQPTEPASSVTVQEEALPVPSEETSTDKTSPEITTEMKSTLTKSTLTKSTLERIKSSEDAKAPEIPSTTSEREEKAPSPTEPKVSGKDESVKTTEEEKPKDSVTITTDETKDGKSFKESETSPKPDLMAIPKEEEIKETSSGDKAMTGAEEPIVPEKPTAIVESKDSHSVVAESNQTQGDKAQEIPSTTPESKEKAPKSPEKEMSPKEPKVSSKDESVKTTEEEKPKDSVTIATDETKDGKSFKESETSPKPDLTAIPKDKEIEETRSGDKAKTGAEKSTHPDKATAVAESKDSHSVVPDSNTTQSEKAHEIPSTTPEEKALYPEKEMSPKEPKVSSKDESVKTTEEEKPKGSVTITTDETMDGKSFKESETSPKPDLMAIPKEEEIKETSSGDKAMTGAEEPIVPEKPTAIVESKDSHSVVAESNQTQGDKAQEIPSTTPESKEKAPKSPEKEMSPKEPKASSKDESVKTTEEEKPKGSEKITKEKDETKNDLIADKKGKESATSPKPDLTAISKEEIKDTSSGDKATIGAEEPIVPEKPTAVAESKDSHSVAPDSNATQSEKVQEIPSTTPESKEKAPKSPEKEMSPKEPKVSSKDESVKTTEEEKPKGSVTITTDETMDGKSFKESETSPKPDLMAIPKEEEIKETSSGDKAMTGAEEPIVPEKPTAIVESKDSHSVVAESNQTQGDKAQEIPSTTPESKEKAPKSPEKEMSPKEPKASSKDESVKTTEEETPKGSEKITKEKDETKNDLIADKKGKESATSPKPDLTAISKEEEIKETSSGDKATTGAEEPIVPEKPTAVAESKDSHKVTQESNTTQEKSEVIAKEPENVQDPSVKTKESEVLTKSQKEAKSEQMELSITKTSPVNDDVSAMDLKEKAVDERKIEEEESKIENDFSEDDGVSKDDKTGSKTKEHVEYIKEQKTSL